MTARSRLVLVVALLACACTRTPIPTVTSGATLEVSPAPSQTTAPSPTFGAGATLVVTGEGELFCSDAFYGGCLAALLLQPYESGPLPVHQDYATPMEFTTERKSLATANVVGPVTGAPARLPVGRWRVGLGRIVSSDAGTCDDPCTSPYFPTDTSLLCADEFEITPLTDRVEVVGHFGKECRIDMTLTPVSGASPSD